MTLKCVDLVDDGLHWPPLDLPCMNPDRCPETGCLWRKWHQIKPSEHRSKEPPKYKPFLELV